MMADKYTFLEKLKTALSERSISSADAAPYLERFDMYYDKMVEDEAHISVLENVENIADNIAAQISEKYDDINRLAERTMTVDVASPKEFEEPTAEISIPDIEADGEYDGEVTEYDPSPIYTEESSEDTADEAIPEVDGVGEDSSRLPDYVEEEPIPNTRAFWVIFGVSAPLWIPLGLLVLGLFCGAWIFLGGLIGASILTMAAVVAVGSAVSLVGIIYGIVQLFISVPIGVYEIGLGIIAAGLAMLFGILIYNFAVRLLPVVIKLVWRFFKYSLKRLKLLFNFLRRECAKL